MQQGAKPMNHDRSTVEAVVTSYFDGLYESNADTLGEIFHPSADLRWLEKGELQVLTRYFTDYLVAMKLAEGWQIVSKSYRYDMRE
jgi:hypothetical protein